MTVDEQLSHGEALDLVADSLDFPLEEARRATLEEHLGSCSSCSRVAERMAKDDQLLETVIDWPDEEYGGEDDEDFDDEPDDDVGQSSGSGGDEDSDERGSGSDQDDDDEDEELDEDEPDFKDATPLGSTEKGTNRGEPEDDKDDEVEDLADDAAARSSAEDMDDDGDGGGLSPDDDSEGSAGGGGEAIDGVGGGQPGHDDTDDLDAMEQAVQDEIERLARGEADSASDEDLADEEAADDETKTLDKLFPDCVADGVTKLDDDKSQRAMAEKALREQEEIDKTEYGSVAVYRSTKGLLQTTKQLASGYGYYVEPTASSHAAAAIRNAILRSRTGTSAIERYQKRGKLDGKSLVKVSMGDARLFKRSIAPDPGKYLIRVTVDVSGSMMGQPIADAAAVARALADASMGTPSVRLEVWAWSNPFAKEHQYYTRGGGYNNSRPDAGIVKVWSRQMPTSSVFDMTKLPMGGTPDATILEWSWRNILKDTRSGEQPVLLMCSDGMGDYRLPDVITRARKHGVDVKSVALGQYMTEDEQLERYGKGNYVPWAGSIEATARPLADMILRMVTGR